MKNFKNNKKLNLLLVALMVCTLSIAQGQKKQKGHRPLPDAEQIEKMVDKLSDELSLSEAQSTKIGALYTDHFKHVEERLKEGRPPREEMENLRSEFENKVRNELTEAQQEAYTTFLEERKEQKRKPQKR